MVIAAREDDESEPSLITDGFKPTLEMTYSKIDEVF
jgi:hypothetical protein